MAHLSAVDKEDTLDSICQDLLISIPPQHSSEKGDETEEPEEACMNVECSTPKKQKVTLSEKMLRKSLKAITPLLLFQTMKLSKQRLATIKVYLP